MKRLLGIILIMVIAAVPAVAAEKGAPKTGKEKLGYSVGYVTGMNMKQDGLDISAEQLSRGIRDGYLGKKGAMTEDEMKGALDEYQKVLVAKQAEAMKLVAEKNKKEGAAYLAENGKKEGVITTASGLQYKVITPGTGKQPKESDSVKVHYRGTTLDGTEFDSSIRRGEPATFPVNGVIAGWKEVLQLMKEGAKWQVAIPSELAYGERGAAQVIGPNQVLLFDVELIQIVQ
ncbi:MAG TPA: FKBP-type peptidyl-prolyl cis-trans isomerase [Dissulfurispiraceae bacterium]|nr:FKBP-type peptidyl-prolyl cis-trans isomerase [Dissulfurispiraceae bacterium]